MQEAVTGDFLPGLQGPLDALRNRYNRRDFVVPDPLQFLYDYPDPGDREVVGLVASCLAFGNVKQILRSVRAVLDAMPQPHRFVTNSRLGTMQRIFADFRHRYVAGTELSDLLFAAGRVVEHFGSLGRCLAAKMEPSDLDAMRALSLWVDEFRAHSGAAKCYLLPSPVDGSACKRLNLFLRWMVRHDDVDPGGWDMAPSLLVVPLDTHMHRIAQRLLLTQRRQADLRTAREVTQAFRRIMPNDPVCYDFALTRLGIRSDGDLEGFLQTCGPPFASAQISLTKTGNVCRPLKG